MTLFVILTLGLGLGANITVFSIVKGVLFVEADFGRSSGRVVSIHSRHPSRAEQMDDAHLSREEFDQLRAAAPELNQVEAYIPRNFTLDLEDGAIRAAGASVTPGLFKLIDAAPVMGRTFTPEDAHDFGYEQGVVLSDGLWKRHYGGDPAIVGRSIAINGRRLEVVGVMEEGFGFPARQQLWLAYKPELPNASSGRFLRAIGLLEEGATVNRLRARLSPLSRNLERRFPDTQRGYRLAAAPFPGTTLGNAAESMTALLVAVVMVLLIICVNLAGLLLARGVARRREMALKLALGASPASLVRGQLIEVLVLSVAGAALGWTLSVYAVPRLVASFPEPPPYWMRFEVDGAAFLYSVALILFSTLVAGLAPALMSGASDIAMGLKEAGRSSSRSVSARFLTEGIVAVQVGVGLALVVAAQMMIQSFTNLRNADAGVRETGLLTLRLYLSGDEVDEPSAKARALARLVEGLEARPAVMRAAVTTAIPADDGGPSALLVAGAASPITSEIPATVVGASDGLFASFGRGVLRGRDFSRHEFEDPSSNSVLVSASLAASLGFESGVVGRSLALRDGAAHDWRTIVGVVPDVQYEEFGEETSAMRRALYVPYGRLGFRSLAVMARTQGPVEPLVHELRAIAKAAHPGIALFDIRTMGEVREATTWSQRFLARVMSLFAMAAMGLAGMGLCAMLLRFVASRTQEIGVRRALGAPGSAIGALVASRAGLVAASGVLLGAALSLAAARGLGGLLFGVNPVGLWTLAGSSGAIVLLVLICAWLPIRRALSVEPCVVLREE